MGIQRSNRHKRTKTGAQRGIFRKKRKFALARPPSNTKISDTRVRKIRVRGGNTKERALKLNSGDFKLHSLDKTFNCKISQVMYHPTNTELMRTNTLTKSAVVKLESEDANKICSTIQEDELLRENAGKGLVYGILESRPGQCGKADGRILQGEELKFYWARFKKSKNK